MRETVVAFILLLSLGAHAGPPLDGRPSERERAMALDVRGKRAPPVVIPSACEELGPRSTVSAAALLAELENRAVRLEDVVLGEKALAAARAELAADRSRLAAERLDLQLQNEELSGVAVGAPADAAGADSGDEVKKLSATVKAMKAEKAAAVLSVLERKLASQVLKTLSKPAAAAIFDRLPPDVAADLMQRIASKHAHTEASAPAEAADASAEQPAATEPTPSEPKAAP